LRFQVTGAQRALIPHRDRSLLSFNVLLSEPSDFEGGGAPLPTGRLL